MKIRLLSSLVVIGAFMLIAQPSMADDLEDLKATHQRYQKAWNTGDLKTAFEIWQDGAIWFPTQQAFPVVTNVAMGLKIFTKWLETHTYRRIWYKADYRVIGNTGLVWGVTTETIMSKTKGTGKRSFCKTSMVFIKSEGKWGAVMEHATPIPTEATLE